MAKVNPSTEFIKYFKNFYASNIQLNAGDWFAIYYDPNEGYEKDVRVQMPTDKDSLLMGTIDLSSCPALDEWFRRKGGRVTFDNEVLDGLRKRKLGDFVGVDYSDDYKIVVEVVAESGEGTEKIEFIKRGGIPRPIECDFRYEIDIPAEALDNPILVVGIKDGKLTMSRDEMEERIFDSPVKNLANIFKKDATYKLRATEEDEDGYRRIAFIGKGTQCELTQYFKAQSY